MNHLILSRYNEPITHEMEQFVGKPGWNVITYCKGAYPRPQEIIQPNVGFEATAYLNWLINPTQKLPTMTLFSYRNTMIVIVGGIKDYPSTVPAQRFNFSPNRREFTVAPPRWSLLMPVYHGKVNGKIRSRHWDCASMVMNVLGRCRHFWPFVVTS